MKKQQLRTGAAVLGVLATLAVAPGCYKDNKEDMYPATTVCDTSSVTYAADVRPILINSCAGSGCHDATASGGYDLREYGGARIMAASGALMRVVTTGTMPKGGSKLDDCSINKLNRWVNLGAQDN